MPRTGNLYKRIQISQKSFMQEMVKCQFANPFHMLERPVHLTNILKYSWEIHQFRQHENMIRSFLDNELYRSVKCYMRGNLVWWFFIVLYCPYDTKAFFILPLKSPGKPSWSWNLEETTIGLSLAVMLRNKTWRKDDLEIEVNIFFLFKIDIYHDYD